MFLGVYLMCTQNIHVMATATAQIHLRTPPKTKSLLQMASDLAGASNLTDYVLRAAVERAQADILNQQNFVLKKAQWTEFTRRLEAPPADLQRLRALLTKPDVFDRAVK